MPRIEIPVRDPAPDAAARKRYFERGQHLARQDLWDRLSDEITEADRRRMVTPGLHPVSDLLCRGARADALCAARSAIQRDEPRKSQVVIASLELDIMDQPDRPGLSALLALLHVDIARIWRGSASLRALAPHRRSAHDRHLRSARDIAERFNPFEEDLPLLAALRCAVLDMDPAPAQRVADDYEDLIDLIPNSPEPMLSLGRDLLPGRYGTWEEVDAQARRTATRTADIWGSGGYAWVWMGALSISDRPVLRIDPPLFAEALHDIMDRYSQDQHMANRLAAFTGLTVGGSADREETRAIIARSFDWIVEDYLRELHPMVWSATPTPSRTEDNDISDLPDSERITRGKARAFSTIAQNFSRHMGNAGRVRFEEDGIRML